VVCAYYQLREPFWEEEGDGKITYLVRRHIKVDLGGTRWARLVPTVLVNRLAREDEVRELLDARIEVSHRLALVKLLRSPVNWASGGDIEYFTSRAESRRFFSGDSASFSFSVSRFLSSSISCRYRSSSASVSTTSFFFAFSCTFLMRCANSNVLVDSATALTSGLSVQTTEMRASPESEGCSMRVSLELRNGTWSLHQMSVTYDLRLS
jgi:hypothetical protein